MKTLIIGLGGCGNNILNLAQNSLEDSYKTVSIQKDLQLLAISKADFKLNVKDSDFNTKLSTLLQYSKEVVFVIGTAGTTAVLYASRLIEAIIQNNKSFKLICVAPNKIEGHVRVTNSHKVLQELDDNKVKYLSFNNDDITFTDKQIIRELKEV